MYEPECNVRVRFLAPFLLMPWVLGGCFQTACPETKTRLINRFDPASASFDPNLLSPAPLGEEGNIQAIIDSNPNRCVDLSEEFRTSAIDGVNDSKPCNPSLAGNDCADDEICARATASTDALDVFECRKSCTDDASCDAFGPGTACFRFDDNEDGSTADDDLRCDNPNLGFCQGILREVIGDVGSRCVACDETALLTCECRSGASSFSCLAGLFSREQFITAQAEDICLRAFPDDNQVADRAECVADFTEANAREERLSCLGVNLNIARLEDGQTPDCERTNFILESGVLCGSDQECIGGRCVFLRTEAFDAQGNPLDPEASKECSSDCSTLDKTTGVRVPNPELCQLGFFCSDNLRNLDGSAVDPSCVSIESEDVIGFIGNLDVSCDIADPNSCGPATCTQVQVDQAGTEESRCTFQCTLDEQCGVGNSCRTSSLNPAVSFCSPLAP